MFAGKALAYPSGNFMNLFSFVSGVGKSKLPCSSTLIFSGMTKFQCLTVPHSIGRHHAIPTNIIIGQKYFTGTNTLAYFSTASKMKNIFIILSRAMARQNKLECFPLIAY
jgi:hypothetical protein